MRARSFERDKIRKSRPSVREFRRVGDRARSDIGWPLRARVAVYPYHLFVPQLRDHIRNLDCSPRRFRATIYFIFEAALARLSFVVEAQDSVDDGNSVSNRDLLERISHLSAYLFVLISFSFQDDADMF